MEVVGDMVNKVTHLMDPATAFTLCGIAVGITFGVAKKFFWIGQVGCKDCKQEAGKRTRSTYDDRR